MSGTGQWVKGLAEWVDGLSALPVEYQDHIIARYKAACVPLLDANSGFEPRTFTAEASA